KRPPGWSPLR
uniref:Lysyl-bradykinin-like n=1 Tax=Oncorhynchus mykiss TaxID=8022 RepID=BRK_ONCMY|nr:RecName: Full=Lysyl-bradykinin-like [Oncorhynchus mykiss]AAB28912.1 lysyl-bradykinin=vasoactive peptide kallidin homolog [Oncorhynchus mykiss=steelhead trout, skamania, plasma, Peptide, 10 aa] [Oncorhynchus mykiss]